MGRRPSLSVWSLLARLCSGEAAPSLFSRSDERELGGPPPTVAELSSASHCEETHPMISGSHRIISQHLGQPRQKMGKVLHISG